MVKPHKLRHRQLKMGQIIYRGALSFQSLKELTSMDGSFGLNNTSTSMVCEQMKDYEQKWYVWKGNPSLVHLGTGATPFSGLGGV